MRTATLTLAAMAALLQSGCVASKDAWTHYDECGAGGSFAQMVDCGKQRRAAYCANATNCGANGATVVLYADSLKASVSRGEMSEPEAMRRWLDYRNSMINQKTSQQPVEVVVRR